MMSQSTSTLSLSQKLANDDYEQRKSISSSPTIAKKSKVILGLLDKAYKQLRQDSQFGSLNFINRISTHFDQSRIQKILNNLTQGYMVIKHSKGTKEPHRKFLYISQDKKFLCWKSIDKSDEKMIQLKKIELIAQGKLIKQWRASSTMTDKLNNCFVIVSQTRTLQIECCHEDEAEKMVEEIDQAVKNSKRMHLCYNF